jgi:hypothetical protein
MSLDATVYCDCYEKGRLREPPPGDSSVLVDSDGSLCGEPGIRTVEELIAWDQWREHRACEHPRGEIVHHRLGNVSLIALLRGELQREASRFPVLLTKVLYNGIHAGDYLPVDLIPTLQREVEALSTSKSSDRKVEEFMSDFRTQMLDLIAASLSVGKPIAF